MQNSLVRFDLYNDLKALLTGFKKSIFLRCYASHEQQKEEHFFLEMLYIGCIHVSIMSYSHNCYPMQ